MLRNYRNEDLTQTTSSSQKDPRKNETLYWKIHRWGDYPIDWDVPVRHVIAKLYKVGFISNTFSSRIPGRAMAVKEGDQDRDFYFDFRQMIDGIVFPRDVEQPPSVEYLLLTAREFAKTNLSARFALLRLWEAPHFYPLMMGPEKRELTPVTDTLGRAWERKIMPKDIPYSEISMHHSARLRIQPYGRLLAERVRVRRNLYLLMGQDEEDMMKYATATAFVTQTEPWKLEMDL